MDPQAKKDSIEQIANKAGILEAYADLKQYLSDQRTVREFHFGYKLLRNFRADLQKQAFRQHLRLALLTSHTSEFLLPLLETDLMLEDLGCEIYTGGYNQIRQEILNGDSGLYEFRPDITIIALELEDIFPDRIANFAGLTVSERSEFRREILDTYESLARSFHQKVPASGRSCLLIQNQGYPFQIYNALAEVEGSLNVFVNELNRDLARLCQEFPNTYLLDYANLMARYGVERWRDPRLYYTVRIPVAQENWLNISDAYVRHIKAILNLDVKCIVVDLDNTLWGGVLGEDGVDNIQLGNAYPGSVFRKFQQYLLSLQASGYILVIASKNNWDDVRQVLDEHKSMVLRQEHFAAVKVNWREKADNIKEVSKEIGISLDHMLFVDDNPVEIHKVRTALPAVNCLQLQSPPLNFPAQFARLRCLGKLAVTEADKQRGEWYFRDRQRRDLRQETTSIDDFYTSLGQRLTVHVNSRKHLPRIVQLAERTNQFNMTTTRLTERCAEDLLARPDALLITAELADRFGDNGIVAFAQIRKLEAAWHIENFLMSCRVLGRMVEEALLDHLIQMAKDQGVNWMEASFIMTKKNAPFADFYLKNGFSPMESNGNAHCRKYGLNISSHIPRHHLLAVANGE